MFPLFSMSAISRSASSCWTISAAAPSFSTIQYRSVLSTIRSMFGMTCWSLGATFAEPLGVGGDVRSSFLHRFGGLVDLSKQRLVPRSPCNRFVHLGPASRAFSRSCDGTRPLEHTDGVVTKGSAEAAAPEPPM